MNEQGLALFDRIIREHGLQCGYTRRSHAVFTEDASWVPSLRKEAEVVAATGAVPDVAFMESVPELPPTIAVKGAVHFGMQVRLKGRRRLAGGSADGRRHEYRRPTHRTRPPLAF
jgi:hypothetical protein